MECDNCRENIPEDEIYEHQGKVLCEDCYMKALNPVNACDPLAVRSATGIRSNLGLKGEDGLTPLQKEIYEFIKSRDKVTAPEIISSFHINQRDLDRIVATLRHCELVKGKKEGEEVYLVPY